MNQSLIFCEIQPTKILATWSANIIKLLIIHYCFESLLIPKIYDLLRKWFFHMQPKLQIYPSSLMPKCHTLNYCIAFCLYYVQINVLSDIKPVERLTTGKTFVIAKKVNIF